ncbi:major facilitator superfamily domain-containing protein [Xylariales sp. PMI_506]|nr:major facilitator superfamily domain-containing protein [Xylariales sp. PMI_506]
MTFGDGPDPVTSAPLTDDRGSASARSKDDFAPGQDTAVEKGPDPVFPGSDAPDGGVVAWLVVLGAWCVSFCSFGWLNSVGVFQEYYQNVLLTEYSASTIAWIPSLQLFFMMGMGPPVGILYDRYGPRVLILGGSFLHVFGIMMTSLGTQYYQILLAQGVCSAIGVSAIFQPAMNSVQGWFNKKRGAAFGILATGSSLGGVVFPIMVSRLINAVGYSWSMRICAFLILALLVIANLTVKARHPPRPQPISRAQLIQPFKEPGYVLLTAGFFFLTYGIFVPLNYLPLQAISAGMSPSLVEYLVPILNAASLFGRLFSGFMGDRIGRFNIFVIVCGLSSLWIFVLWLVDSSNAALIAFAALFGFCSGAYVSLISPLIMQISPISEIGFRSGIVFFCSATGGLTTNVIAGAILDATSDWIGVKVFSGVFCLVGTAIIFASRINHTGWNLFAIF